MTKAHGHFPTPAESAMILADFQVAFPDSWNEADPAGFEAWREGNVPAAVERERLVVFRTKVYSPATAGHAVPSVPPFAGFPPAASRFLHDLEANNDRDWFQAHKQDYVDSIVTPAQSFVIALGERLQKLLPGLRYDTRTDGRGSLGRIYRDVRFSKDKRPFYTHVRIAFWEGPGKKRESPGFGVYFEDGGWGVHGGIERFPEPLLDAYRHAVVDASLGPELEAAVAPMRKGRRYEIGGLTYARVPRGFDADHPRARWLLHDGLWATRGFEGTRILHSPAFVDRCFELCLELAPLHRWLVKVDRRTRGRR